MEPHMVPACHTPQQGNAVVSTGNAKWTTSKTGYQCPCRNCSQWPPTEKTGRRSLLNHPSCPPDDPTITGPNWTDCGWSRSGQKELFASFFAVFISFFNFFFRPEGTVCKFPQFSFLSFIFLYNSIATESIIRHAHCTARNTPWLQTWEQCTELRKKLWGPDTSTKTWRRE